MRKYIIAVCITTLIYFVVALGCIYWSDKNIIDGNWGSVSDLVIAVFTWLISLATTLLLVVALVTGDSWLHQKKYDQANELIAHLSELYFLSHLKLSCRKKVNALKSIESIKTGDKQFITQEVRDLLSRLGIDPISWDEMFFNDKELVDFKNFFISYRDHKKEKMLKAIKDIEVVKFKVLISANILSKDLIKENIDIMGEVNSLIELEENFHEFGSSLFDRVLKALKLTGEYQLIHIQDPPEEPPLLVSN